jgi:SAM-dependent methyltransferase
MTYAILMVERPCPVCGSTDESRVIAEAKFDAGRLDEFAFSSRKTPEYMHHRLIACPTCDVVYANPLPARDPLVKAYEDAAFDSSTESHYASRTYGALLSRIMNKLPDRAGALDIGTGDGAFLEQLLARGFTDVVGVEPSKAPIAAAAPSIRPLIRHGALEAQPVEPARYRVVTCFQTLEHLYDPLGMCRNAYTMLKEDGALFVISHNRRSVSAKLLGMKSPIYDIEHLQLFSPRSAQYLLAQAGFSEVDVRIVRNTYPLSYWLKLLPLPIAVKRGCISAATRSAIGNLPLSVPAGNMAVVGYKRTR